MGCSLKDLGWAALPTSGRRRPPRPGALSWSSAWSPYQWRVPDGFKVATQPARIDESAVGRFLYLNWKDYGWSLGKVTELITKSTPLLFKKYNVCAIWAVEGRLNKKCKGPCMLDLKICTSRSGARCRCAARLAAVSGQVDARWLRATSSLLSSCELTRLTSQHEHQQSLCTPWARALGA